MPTKFQAKDRVMDFMGRTGAIVFIYAGSKTQKPLYEIEFEPNQTGLRLGLRYDHELRHLACLCGLSEGCCECWKPGEDELTNQASAS